MSERINILLYDAHAHLPGTDSTKHSTADEIVPESFDLQYVIINGTSTTDWEATIEFAEKNSRVLPAIGLHPQKVQNAPDDWKTFFLQLIESNPICAIGEIGLDRKDRHNDVEKQLDAFCWQLQQAHARDFPVSIHCLKATGMLMDTLRTQDLPSRGIHLHAYNGSVELIPELVELGAYFSFAARQLDFNSKKIQDRICAVPIQRLLIETDANYRNDCSTLYHCYKAIAEIRNMPLEKLAETTAENFETYFLNP